MFFTLSKVAFLIAQPSTLTMLLIVGGLLASVVGFRRIGRGLAGLGLTALLILALTPLGPYLLTDLENRFPIPAADAPAPAGIVVLGGFTDARMGSARGVVGLGEGAAAIFEVAELAKRYPAVPIVLSGGSNALVGTADASEAELMRRLFVAVGVAPERLVLEEGSRTTWENATATRDLVKPAAGATWWLVTTAFHMPRAIATFRAAGWTGIVARPAAYATTGRIGLRPPMLWGLMSADMAVKEWLGILVYRLTGRASELRPGP
ncbi:YdcF family protein [Pinisolibacter sp.]|uniref:YdcF family protein n=1 Tax=Pinisolibacter sp. TaxID=2172024 RepID=UPI002FDD86F4